MNRKTAITLFVALSLSSLAHADTSQGHLIDAKGPTFYTYAIKSRTYQDAGEFVRPIRLVIPNTAWLCELTMTHLRADPQLMFQSLITQCSTPSITGQVEILTRVSCVNSDQDTATVHLSSLDPNQYATIYIACRKDLPDDGF